MLPTHTTTVQEMLQNDPATGRVLMRYDTDCLGCRLAHFCTLAEVAEAYRLDLEAFLDALQQPGHPLPKSEGAKHEKD